MAKHQAALATDTALPLSHTPFSEFHNFSLALGSFSRPLDSPSSSPLQLKVFMAFINVCSELSAEYTDWTEAQNKVLMRQEEKEVEHAKKY